MCAPFVLEFLNLTDEYSETELENALIRVSHVRVGRQCFILGRDRSCSTGPLVSEARDLAVELANRPAPEQSLTLIVFPCLSIRDGEQPDVVGPWQRETRPRSRFGRRRLPNSSLDQFGRHCLRNWPAQIEKPHLPEVAFGKAPAESCREILSEPLQKCLSVTSSFQARLFVFHDPLADQPIRRRQHHIYGSDGGEARLFYQTDDAAQQFTVGIARSLRRSPFRLAGTLFRRLLHEL